MKHSITSNFKALSKFKVSKYGKNFLRTWDKDDDCIKATLVLSELIKNLYQNNISSKVFESGQAISIFRDNSTRTRYSYAAASNLLGLDVHSLDEEKSQIAHGETVMETSNMLSFLTRTIGIRDDIYLGLGHSYMLEVAKSVDKGYKEGSISQRPGIINLQCDEDHPTQSMADLAYLINHFGDLKKLKGKKIVMSWAYSPSYGKPLSVPQGVIGLMSRFGMDITLAYPKGYNLITEIEDLSKKQAKKSGGSFKIEHNMGKAFKDADIVYPKSWASYAVMKKRTKLLKKGDKKGLKNLVKYSLDQNAEFKNWTCTEKLMKTTKNGSALYMHCLPADITDVSCKEGEVDKATFSKYRKQTYLEAGYKPFVIAAMMLLTQYQGKTSEIVKKIISRNSSIVLL